MRSEKRKPSISISATRSPWPWSPVRNKGVEAVRGLVLIGREALHGQRRPQPDGVPVSGATRGRLAGGRVCPDIGSAPVLALARTPLDAWVSDLPVSERVSRPTTVVTSPCKAAGTRAACVGATNRPRRAAWNTASGVLNTRAARGALIVASTNSRVASSLTSVAPAARM